ncbi:MAG: hypothetical protein HYW47_06045 [Deltaproteobacteria bacterium]|nr:hypothetical protein [Deltaproteobacteria bacterium]
MAYSTQKQDLLALSEELTKTKPNKKKVSRLLQKVGIPENEDPFLVTNEILKRLHRFEEILD